MAALPDAFPVKLPTNVVDVIEVAPVTTPASILIIPSNTIADPAGGLIFSAPDKDDMVLPSIFILSTVNAVSVPSDVMLVCAACVTVAALPDALPVKLPTNVDAASELVAELYCNPPFVYNALVPVASLENIGKHIRSVDSDARFTLLLTPVTVPEKVPVIVPPTFKLLSIPTPPLTIRAPVSLSFDCVVLLIVTTPASDTVAAVEVPNEILPPLIAPVVVMLFEPLLMEPNPVTIEPALRLLTLVIFGCAAV